MFNKISKQAKSEQAAVLVELTYVIVFILLISISTLELVNFIRYHKLAMSLSYESANLIFKECPSVQRNLLEEQSVQIQTSNGGNTPNGVLDCFSRNLNDFRVFLSSSFFGTRDWSSGVDCALPPTFLHVELYNGATASMSRTFDTSPAGNLVAQNLATCSNLIQAASASPIISTLIAEEKVVVRTVVYIPYRGILLSGDFLLGFFSGTNSLANGGIYAETII